ncbi:MAG: type II toxin-antitoxin system Phd/YefM family antitoxin [Acidobacteriia bacterium]|nr:type II toxin-antitoxin system Phd/YefM family antitoxin [Terriglobia bacterium]
MRITASRLREDVYRILDEAIETGRTVEIVRRGKIVRLVPEERASRLARLKKRTGFEGNPDDIAGMDWSKEWSELK